MSVTSLWPGLSVCMYWFPKSPDFTSMLLSVQLLIFIHHCPYGPSILFLLYKLRKRARYHLFVLLLYLSFRFDSDVEISQWKLCHPFPVFFFINFLSIFLSVLYSSRSLDYFPCYSKPISRIPISSSCTMIFLVFPSLFPLMPLTFNQDKYKNPEEPERSNFSEQFRVQFCETKLHNCCCRYREMICITNKKEHILNTY